MSPATIAAIALEAMRALPGWADFCALEAPTEEPEQQKEAA